jgi:hypothetical protein
LRLLWYSPNTITIIELPLSVGCRVFEIIKIRSVECVCYVYNWFAGDVCCLIYIMVCCSLLRFLWYSPNIITIIEFPLSVSGRFFETTNNSSVGYVCYVCDWVAGHACCLMYIIVCCYLLLLLRYSQIIITIYRVSNECELPNLWNCQQQQCWKSMLCVWLICWRCVSSSVYNSLFLFVAVVAVFTIHHHHV